MPPVPKITTFRSSGHDSTARFSATWTPAAAEQRDGALAGLLGEEGPVQHGTSLWFVGATGLPCCSDETRFEPAGAAAAG